MSPKIVTSSRRISALPRAVISRSATPSISSASITVAPSACAGGLLCASTGAEKYNASSATQYRIEPGSFIVDVRILMIHADPRRDALERWLSVQLRGVHFSLTPASEDASFRRYF